MRISATYASRPDLSSFQKIKFTLEERIEYSAWVRAFYRRCFLLPKWVKGALEAVWFMLGLFPLILANGLEALVQKALADEDSCGRGEGIGLALFLAILGTLAYFHWIGWALLIMTLQFFLVLWFGEVMRDYEDKLRRELAV